MADSKHSNTSSASVKSRVFRVRNLPAHMNGLAAVELLSQSINGVTAQDIKLYSLAHDVDIWPRLMTKTATITFQINPPGLTSISRDGECTIKIPGLPSAKPLIIDHHFQGVTPLNDVPDHEHKYDCLIISGLSSHPFGSWQTHGTDKSFMWVRDDLPERLPGIRFLTYGYDTSLAGSTSFQLVQDLAISLVQTMKVFGWAAPSAKPMLFLAHSLGGVVLKQALVILAGAGNRERSILGKIKGAVFFGVPSQGMDVRDILNMLGDQSNVSLVKELSDQSEYLPRLDEQFENISWLKKIQFFWAFETKYTPSVQKAVATGKFARTGSGTIMVSRESATRNLCHLQPSSTIQIDENHSDMVKFGIGDQNISILASTLKTICALSETPVLQLEPGLVRNLNVTRHKRADLTETFNKPKNTGKTETQRRSDLQPERTLPRFWYRDSDEILSSLRAPERDRRLQQIDEKLGDTLNWAYDDPCAGLSEWLRKGTGIFWIHGKPGSGKSTLMKYLYQDPRTEELLRAGGWQSRARLTTTSFFFHHRGTNMQKSFEGLLRSVVSQILEQHEPLLPLLYSILDKKSTVLAHDYQTLITSARLGTLEEDIWSLLSRLIPQASEPMTKAEDFAVSQFEMTRDRHLGIHLRRMLKDLGVNTVSPAEDPFEKGEFDDNEFMDAVQRELLQEEEEQESPSQVPEPTSWVTMLGRTVKRHYQREKVRTDLQAASWNRANLEECLSVLIGQSIFKMDLFLLLDALDEYDGRPEFIASFLQELVRQPADHNHHPLTVVRILFSSRPWKLLQDEFTACPGFQIHDFTENDIIEFCATSITPDHNARRFLSPLVMEIVRRARGVFIWVQLVIRDLTKIVVRRVQMQNDQELEQELYKALDAIPDELHDYYLLILQRIPPSNRWESYVVLETLCRSDEDMGIERLVEIVKCATVKSIAQVHHKLEQYYIEHGRNLKWGEQYIKAVSGGLVELGGVSSHAIREPSIFQFMHQTVKQFVEGPRFKIQLLGESVGMFVTENGHSFIAKHLFATKKFPDRLFRHAREAETIMGFSQHEFFNTAPRQQYDFLSGIGGYMPINTLQFSVVARLQLCFRDSGKADPSPISRQSANFVRMLLEAATKGDGDNDMNIIIDMAQSLVSRGLLIQDIDDGFLSVVQHMWGTDRVMWPAFENLCLVLLDAVKLTSTPKQPSSSKNIPNKPTADRSSGLVTKVLHQATPKLVRALLARGFDPNSLDNRGFTPMDCVVDLISQLTLPEQHDIVSQLACHEGVLRVTRRSRWDEFEAECAGSKLDTAVFHTAGLPLWYSSKNPARKHRSLGMLISQQLT